MLIGENLIMLIFISIIVVLSTIFYVTGIEPIRYWKRRGVSHILAWPYFGNRISTVLKRRSLLHVLNKHYNAFSGRRYFGFYNMRAPVLVLRDPDLIKQITVEEFEIFPEHRRFIPDEVDQLWSKNLFAMKGGREWKEMREVLTPAFTPSKLKRMFDIIKERSEQFSNHLLERDQSVMTVELKEAFTRFASDVIAATAFGLTCNSLENGNNDFYTMGKVISNFNGWRNLTQLLHLFSPKLSEILKLPFYPKKESNFFKGLIEEIINVRENEEKRIPDVIHLLMKARDEKKLSLTNDDITSQVMIFFFAGFETFSTMLCYTFYELAINPDIQKTLYAEVDKTLRHCDGNITYDALMQMEYLDMVIQESLRKWPPFIFFDRCSTKPFTIKPEQPEEKLLHLESGTVCIIPAICIQRDPKYFADPERFNPERFNKINKKTLNPYTNLPFGIGPRNCIGSRFSLLEGKLIVVEMLRNFEIVPSEKTEIPLVMNAGRNNAVPTNGFWVDIKQRE